MTVSFDEQWNADDDPYAVILSPASPAEAYERRAPTLDDLLDLRIEINSQVIRVVDMDDRAYNDGLRVAVSAIDKLLASL